MAAEATTTESGVEKEKIYVYMPVEMAEVIRVEAARARRPISDTIVGRVRESLAIRPATV